MSRVYGASAEDVFDAWVNPEKISKWFGCDNTKEARALEWNPAAGGQGILDMISSSGSEGHGGKLKLGFIEVERPSKLVFTFAFLGDCGGSAPDMPGSKVTVEFNALGDESTEMILTHSDIPSGEMRDGVTQGWGQGLDKLERLLG